MGVDWYNEKIDVRIRQAACIEYLFNKGHPRAEAILICNRIFAKMMRDRYNDTRFIAKKRT